MKHNEFIGQVQHRARLSSRGAAARTAPDPATNTLQMHQQAEPGDEDLPERAATQMLLYNGAVYAVEQANMHGEARLSAVFRY
jgi:hypothetical protein